MKTIEVQILPSPFKMFCLMLKKSKLENILAGPDIQCVIPNLHSDLQQLEQYRILFDLPQTQMLPITFPFILTMPLQIKLFAHPKIYLNPLGFLHVSNFMVQHRPISQDEALTASCYIQSAELVKKGIEIKVRITVSNKNEALWECTSTYLKMSKRYRSKEGEENNKRKFVFESIEPVGQTHSWRVTKTDAFAYASVSKDYNLVHLSKVFARLMGLPTPIIHGMWSIGKCLHYLDLYESGQLYFYHVFKGPIPLNSNVQLQIKTISNGKRFDVFVEGNAKPCIQGILSTEPLEV